MTPLLEITRLSKVFGGLMALREINLVAQAGQIVGIIGPNGAGKTTLFNCLTSLYYPSGGEIRFKNQSIVPEFSTRKRRLIHLSGLVFLFLSLAWAPLFWSFSLPRTFYKVEMGLLGAFLLFTRIGVARGLRQYQIWAWGLIFVFLSFDMGLALWWLTHPFNLGHMLGTRLSLGYFAFPWCAVAVPFSGFLVWQLFLPQVRQLFGFKMGPDAVSRLGIARTFQNIRLFFNLSVLDNVKIGAHAQIRSGLWGSLFRNRLQREEEGLSEKAALEHLRFVGLEHRAFDLAGALPYGEQRRLEIARALASNPDLLLLDEPAAGMNPQESSRLIQLIRKIRDRGVTILIIEHDMKVMMNLADGIYVLDYGVLIAHGSPDEIRADPKVIKAYLGGGAPRA